RLRAPLAHPLHRAALCSRYAAAAFWCQDRGIFVSGCSRRFAIALGSLEPAALVSMCQQTEMIPATKHAARAPIRCTVAFIGIVSLDVQFENGSRPHEPGAGNINPM